MKQANRPAFWLALEAVQETREDDYYPGLYVGDYYVGCDLEPAFKGGAIDWCDPHNENEVRLEVLIGGWFAVAAKYTTQERAHYEWTSWFFSAPRELRVSIISAICKLANLED